MDSIRGRWGGGIRALGVQWSDPGGVFAREHERRHETLLASLRQQVEGVLYATSALERSRVHHQPERLPKLLGVEGPRLPGQLDTDRRSTYLRRSSQVRDRFEAHSTSTAAPRAVPFAVVPGDLGLPRSVSAGAGQG
jgi:hypothetical protein